MGQISRVTEQIRGQKIEFAEPAEHPKAISTKEAFMVHQKVLFVLTSTDALGDTGHRTGAFLSEITHPYEELTEAGFKVDMMSPLGGKVPLDGFKLDDAVNATLMNDAEFLNKIESSKKPQEINALDYVAIYFAGGHGAMFDFPENREIQKIATDIYQNEGVLAAVCHGVAGFVNLRLEDGSYLVHGHEISCFTNEEEETVGMETAVPFLLQTRLQERGAHHTSAPRFSSHVVKSGRLVTGQNPASARGVARALIEVIDFIEEGLAIPEKNWCEWKDTLERRLDQGGLP